MVDQTQMYPSSISPLGLFQGIICSIHSVIPLCIGGLGFFKNHRRCHEEFLVKMGDVANMEWVVCRKGNKHCFSLIMYGFVAVMLFNQQVFQLGCLLIFQIKSHLGIAYQSVDYKKAFNVF